MTTFANNRNYRIWAIPAYSSQPPPAKTRTPTARMPHCGSAVQGACVLRKAELGLMHMKMPEPIQNTPKASRKKVVNTCAVELRQTQIEAESQCPDKPRQSRAYSRENGTIGVLGLWCSLSFHHPLNLDRRPFPKSSRCWDLTSIEFCGDRAERARAGGLNGCDRRKELRADLARFLAAHLARCSSDLCKPFSRDAAATKLRSPRFCGGEGCLGPF